MPNVIYTEAPDGVLEAKLEHSKGTLHILVEQGSGTFWGLWRAEISIVAHSGRIRRLMNTNCGYYNVDDAKEMVQMRIDQVFRKDFCITL